MQRWIIAKKRAQRKSPEETEKYIRLVSELCQQGLYLLVNPVRGGSLHSDFYWKI